MNRSIVLVILAVVVSLASLITWQVTGGDWYTKFQVVEQVETEADPDDPLTAAGFYDDGTVTRTEARDEFRLGMLPTPAGLLDKHLLSVTSLAGPFWALALGLFLIDRRRRRRPHAAT